MSSQASTPSAQQLSGYVYDQLSKADREKYRVMLESFQSREAKDYPDDDVDDIARIYECVMADHPEFFYVDGYYYHTWSNTAGKITRVTVEGQLCFSAEESAKLQKKIDAEVKTILAGLPKKAGDYEKAKYFYEYLVNNVEYDHVAANDGPGSLGGSKGQTIAESLVAHKSVCAGYARAFEYLLQKQGIETVHVTGTGKGGSHAWCAVRLGGNWYFVDPTWGDPQFTDESGQTGDSGRINYNYLCVTGADLSATHVADSPFKVPACTATADNYYIHEGLFLASADIDAAGAIIQAAADRGDGVARFRCANWDVYSQLFSELMDNGGVYRFIPGNSCSYTYDDNMLTIEVIF